MQRIGAFFMAVQDFSLKSLAKEFSRKIPWLGLRQDPAPRAFSMAGPRVVSITRWVIGPA